MLSSSLSTLLPCMVLLSARTLAIPTAQGSNIVIPDCTVTERYANDDPSTQAQSLPKMLGGTCDASNGGCTIGLQKEASFEVTVNIGASIDTGEVVGAGIDIGVSYTQGMATAEVTTQNCPGGAYQCGAYYAAGLVRATGVKTTTYGAATCGDATTENYSVDYPQTDAEGLLVYELFKCACGNAAAGLDVCPEAC